MPSKVLNISECSSLALHAARAVARAGSPMTAERIAGAAGVSRHHLSKALRKMVEAGIISSSRGPNGGFFFTEEQKRLPLMRIMDATGSGEAKCPCMFDTPRCGGNDCLFGTLLKDANRLYNSYFSKTRISDLARKRKQTKQRKTSWQKK